MSYFSVVIAQIVNGDWDPALLDAEYSRLR